MTHAHDDHAGFLNYILTMNSHVKIIMSKKALEKLYCGENSFNGYCTGYISFSFCQFMKLVGKGTHQFPPLKSCYEERCIVVSNNNKKQVGNMLGGTIIETSGHTVDSIISLLLNDGTLFCGDAIMNGFPSVHKITIWLEDINEF